MEINQKKLLVYNMEKNVSRYDKKTKRKKYQIKINKNKILKNRFDK